jgi:hypothetical protein
LLSAFLSDIGTHGAAAFDAVVNDNLVRLAARPIQPCSSPWICSRPREKPPRNF